VDALRGGDERVAVGDVGRDGNRAGAELVGQRLDAVGAARQQGEAVAVGGQGAGGGLADAGRGADDDRDAAGVGVGAYVDLLGNGSWVSPTVPADQRLWGVM
jgi:hypothetical protein